MNNPDAGTNRHARGDGIAADGVAREERLFDCGWLNGTMLVPIMSGWRGPMWLNAEAAPGSATICATPFRSIRCGQFACDGLNLGESLRVVGGTINATAHRS